MSDSTATGAHANGPARSALTAIIATLGDARQLAGAVPVWHAVVPRERLRTVALDAASKSARLAALWGADDRERAGTFALHVALAFPEGMLWLQVPVPAGDPRFPDLTDLFAPADRMQRAIADLLGLRSSATDQRPWLRHGAWPDTAFPLRSDASIESAFPAGNDAYPFVRVEGEGVHEIPVGPVHAGTIEPGHFRFSVVGEKVVRLEERLGYKHKGIDKLFGSFDLVAGARLAARVSGDSTVAFAWAYAMAAEGIAAIEVPLRAVALRAIALERERIANHLGDLGYLGNDGGLAFGLAQFMRLKEDVLRLNAALAGHRYLMDWIQPGGMACDVAPEGVSRMLEQCDRLHAEVRLLRGIYDDHSGLQDRFQQCGRVSPELAHRLGVIGLAGRASGQPWDARRFPGHPPYERLALKVVTLDAGDVAARVNARFAEIFESLCLLRAIAESLPPGEVRVPLALDGATGSGLGWVEGWRGEAIVAIEAAHGAIVRAHAHDPSWQNWPALEHAILGNIVPDFPLINKSFNLSYSGHDG